VAGVLVADSDASLISAMLRGLEQIGVDAVGVTYRQAFERELERSAFELLIVERGLVSDEQLCVLHDPRVVLLVAYAPPGESARLSKSFRLLQKPFSSLELSVVVRHELGLRDFRAESLIDALRRAHHAKQTICLRVQSSSESARIYLVAGEVVHAVCGPLRGEAALRAALTDPLRVSSEDTPHPAERSIVGEFHDLVLRTLDQLDVAERAPTPAAPRSSLRLTATRSRG
jgi:hypothetical protein